MRGREIAERYLGLIVLIAAMLAASTRVLMVHARYEAPGVDTISICHWQLESGFRNSLDDLIAAYEKSYVARTGKRIKILQVPISERGYRQFVNTGMIGGTAPDIIERGKAKTAEQDEYVIRFYMPLGQYVNEANPYNKGTPLEGVAWKDTFVDGLAGSYHRGLREYYQIPFSLFTVRVYYNIDLLKRITGSGEPPDTYGELMDICRQVREYAAREGIPLSPIAGSKQQFYAFVFAYEWPFHFPMISRMDTDLGGSVDPLEAYQAYRKGVWSFRSPELVTAWKCLQEILGEFQDGWMAAQRDDAVFMFAQGRAVMHATGSWDAKGLFDQAGDRFSVGVFDLPIPTDHPVYSKYVKGPATEANQRGGIPWAVNLKTKHPDLCIDFLRFCTTTENNSRFNQPIFWIPVVRGAPIPQRMMPFKPRIKGFFGRLSYHLAAESRVIASGNFWSLCSGDLTAEDYGEELATAYERTAANGYSDMIAKQHAHHRNLQRPLAVLEAAACVEEVGADTARGKGLQFLQSVQAQAMYTASNEGRYPDKAGETP